MAFVVGVTGFDCSGTVGLVCLLVRLFSSMSQFLLLLFR